MLKITKRLLDNPVKIFGISGVARSGKDTFADFIIKKHPKTFVKQSMAYEVKKDLDPFLKEKLGISAFTEESEEKEIIRPMLITWGTDVMRKLDKDCWVKKINKKIIENSRLGFITIVPDIRFLNEFDFVAQNKGVLVHVKQQGKFPIGDLELETETLEEKADFVFNTCFYEDYQSRLNKKIEEFLKRNNIC